MAKACGAIICICCGGIIIICPLGPITGRAPYAYICCAYICCICACCICICCICRGVIGCCGEP